jgi:hypothetical protein
MNLKYKAFVIIASASAVVPVTVAAASASAAVKPAATVQATATTTISNRPDGGVQGDWALDNFTRVATVKLVGEVAATNCPNSDTGHCYLWNATIKDTGHFTTIAMALAPRVGVLDRQLTGIMAGGAPNEQFYSSWKTPKASRVPTTENDNGQDPTGKKTTTNWVEQFFGASAVFNSAANPGGPDLGTKWSWTYTLNFGSNNQCPNDAYKWVDAAASNSGASNTDGNILTPNTADCT